MLYGVARLEEALALRAARLGNPIVLMEGVFDADQMLEAAQQQLECVVHSEEQLAWLEQAPVTQRFVVWLKIDTGMNRLGFRAGQCRLRWPGSTRWARGWPNCG